MSLLVSKFEHPIDSKLRISVPSDFRSSLINSEIDFIMLYPSIRNNCIEGCSVSRFNEIAEMISNMDDYSDERDALEFAIFAEASKISIDKQGRMVLPKKFLDRYNLSSQVVFVGKGKFFEIWNKEDLQNKMSSLNNIKLKHQFFRGV